MQFYQFSKDLSLLTQALISARIDLLFFLAMFIMILLGYALMGYFLLGHSMLSFSTISNSMIYSYLMLLGVFDLDQIKSADNILGLVFFSSFIILFYLLLLNIFTAIIAAHFDKLQKEEDRVDQPGFFSKI